MEVFINASSSADLTKGLTDFFQVSFIFYFVIILVAFYFVGLSFYKH